MVQMATSVEFADVEKEKVKYIFKQPDGGLLFLTRGNWGREDLAKRTQWTIEETSLRLCLTYRCSYTQVVIWRF